MNKHKLKEKRKQMREKAGRKPLGFHVYRSVDENLPFVFWEKLTDEPIKDGNFNDQAAEIGQRYFYKLTQVDAEGRESAPVTPRTSFTDHAGNVSEQNPLVDFAGYNMYRSIDKNVPLNQWERRNKEPIPTTEYKDEGVQSGEIYFYYVRAVDSKGNESAAGEILRVVRK
jgi:fibronectin type 3 domain-containing protein